MVARRPMLLAVLAAAVAAGPSCEGERPPPAQATTDTATVPPPNAQLSAREVLDTADAIEKFLNAGRAREALLLARHLGSAAGIRIEGRLGQLGGKFVQPAAERQDIRQVFHVRKRSGSDLLIARPGWTESTMPGRRARQAA